MKSFYIPKQALYVLVIAINLLMMAFAQNTLAQGESENKCRLDIQTLFTASGWMGDGVYGRKYLEFEGACEKEPHSKPFCIEIRYTFGPKGWAGIYWQNKPNNWGDEPGNNYSKEGFKRIVFWAKGETGKEVVEFKTGDINDPTKKHHDSFGKTIGRVILTKEWKLYVIDLEHANLSSVIGGFCWVASRNDNNQKSITFYIDDICFE
jgi:hypothetical protein